MSRTRSSATRPRAAASIALLAAAFKSQSAGVFIARRTPKAGGLKIVFANDSFRALTGFADKDLVGREYTVLHVDRAELERVRSWLPVARRGEPLTGEGFLVRADGSTVLAAWSFDPLCNARGQVTHVIATYRDQTEKRRLQEALVHAQRLDAVGRLAGGVAHDFNNLVSVINGYCEILSLHVGTNAQALREVTEIHQAGRKAAALTQQLLAFSRRQPFHSRVLNLNTLIQEHAGILRRLIGEAGRLDLELSESLSHVRTDATQFQQVILNLVLNARDALRDKGRILVRTEDRELTPGLNRRATDPVPGRYVALTVSDNGTGMDTETMQHLFEPFFTTKPEGKGTGLGLALVYGVVQQSGGTIRVNSELLVGSTFEILLPAVDEPADDPAPPPAPLPSIRGHENVWLIESDEVVRKMVAGMLTADGYRVTAMGSATEAAVETAPLKSVQLIITTRRSENVQLVEKIAAHKPDLKVLLIGEYGDERPFDIVPGERLARLTKPYALSELLRSTRKLLDSGAATAGEAESAGNQ